MAEQHIIEEAWRGFVKKVYDAELPREQHDEMRRVWFAGAFALWTSLMSNLDEGDDATEFDLGRMQAIENEFERFQLEAEALAARSAGTEASLKPTCGRTGCDRAPTHYLVLKIPPHGGSMAQALKAAVGVVLCRDHAEEATAVEILANGTDRIRDAVTATGKLAPDFERAEIEVRRVGDAFWNDVQARVAISQGGGRA
ncbi:hypothetical protein HRJ34_14690 [Rhizorhabdus wittichii]|uniref:Uncharacterized protein n=1 Tax=Rhizorhabdus wittichii TaxID=160791 RepID=A0A975CYG5_9SPHN|nr:hypothetical protein [Rhizorhabdus wittichii]QTH19622.1 hypothetical protein HRJ34_14690 [Rhizorhabdus wittichii]